MTGLLLQHLHHPAVSLYLAVACVYAQAAMLSACGEHRGFARLYSVNAMLHAAMGLAHAAGMA